MKTFCRTLLVSLFILQGWSFASACECADWSQRHRFRAADSVFLGEVIQFRELQSAPPDEKLALFAYEVTFKVERQWKGKSRSQITTLADFDNPGMCNDLHLDVGRRVLVYAPKVGRSLVINRDCGPNVPEAYAKKEIARLDDFIFRIYTFLYPYPKF
jgi:hypothetical protein